MTESGVGWCRLTSRRRGVVVIGPQKVSGGLRENVLKNFWENFSKSKIGLLEGSWALNRIFRDKGGGVSYSTVINNQFYKVSSKSAGQFCSREFWKVRCLWGAIASMCRGRGTMGGLKFLFGGNSGGIRVLTSGLGLGGGLKLLWNFSRQSGL